MTEHAGPNPNTMSIPGLTLSPASLARHRGDIATYVALCIGAVIMMLPFLWMLSSSFKPESDILVYPPQMIPAPWTLENYRYVLEETRFLTFIKNSLIVVAFTITGHVVSGSLVAYGFARFRFPG